MKYTLNEKSGTLFRDDRYGSVYETAAPSIGLLRSLGFATVVINPQKESPAHFHARTEEIYYILEGSGLMTIDGDSEQVGPGDTISIPLRAVHKIKNIGDHPLRFVCATNPPYSVKDDYEVERRMQEGEPILILSGTTRPGSNTLHIARRVAEIYAHLQIPAKLMSLAELPAAAFAPEALVKRPVELKPLTDPVLRAAGLVLVTPEYNGSFPGMLKHFIDLLPFPQAFERQPVCFIGLAAMRAVEQLQNIFSYRNAFIYPDRVFLPGIDDLLDENGRLKAPELDDRLKKQAVGFAAFVQQLLGVNLVAAQDTPTAASSAPQ